MIPTVAGVSDLQRRGKEVLAPIKGGGDEVVLLSDRNHVFGAIMSIDHYKALLSLASAQEDDFWTRVSEKNLDFWMDP
ncbi:MAG: hypothetical protein V1880_02595, partial [Patescibacteria group bacterium]